MGSIIGAIYDDINEYILLCKQYNEKIQYSHGSEDCYGKHANKLKKWAREDYSEDMKTLRERAERRRHEA
jgi:hypothetical protein